MSKTLDPRWIPSRRSLTTAVLLMVVVGMFSIPLASGHRPTTAIPSYLTSDSPALADYAESIGVATEDITFDLGAAHELDDMDILLCSAPGEPNVPVGYETRVPVECERPLDARLGIVMGLISAGAIALGGIILRSSRNAWGLYIAVGGVTLQLIGIAAIYAEKALVIDPGTLPFGYTALSVFAGGWVVLGVVLAPRLVLSFPTGYPPSPRWRWVLWLSSLAAGILLLMIFLSPVMLYELNPIQVMSVETNIAIFDVGILVWIYGALSGAIVSLIVRFWRSEGEERLQLKWVTTAAILAVVANTAQTVFGRQDVLGPVAALFSIVVLPASILIALFKYRLYDIDRVISRTVGYTVVIVILGGLYAFGAVWLPTLLVGGDSPPVFVASSTVVVAFLFNPLRRRVLTRVDRRFNRTRFDPERVVEDFSRVVVGAVDSQQLADDWAAVVSRTMEPAILTVWLSSALRSRNVSGTGRR